MAYHAFGSKEVFEVMATPYSQIIGSLAVFKMTSRERYKIVPEEVVEYAAGVYGELDGTMDQEVKDKILSSSEARKLINWIPPDVSFKRPAQGDWFPSLRRSSLASTFES